MSNNINSPGNINATATNSGTLVVGSVDYQIMLAVERTDGTMSIICTQDALHPPKVTPSALYISKPKVDWGEKIQYLTNDALQQTLRGSFDPRTYTILEESQMKYSDIRCFCRVAAIFDPNGAVYAECSRITAEMCKTETYRFLDHPQRSEWTIDLITRAVVEDELLK